jgi:hypothetical protein
MGWSPSVARALSEPCEVCARSDLLAGARGIARLPHGVTHPLVNGIEGRLEGAQSEYLRLRMAAVRAELERRLAVHDFERDPDLFEVGFRQELRAEYLAHQYVEEAAAAEWAAGIRDEVRQHLVVALGSVGRGLIEVLQVKLRQLEWDIPDELDPAEVLGDVRLVEYLRPAFDREVEEWMAWLAGDGWRLATAVREGERCLPCARSPIAGLPGGLPHGVAHALRERLDTVGALALDGFEFALAELPHSPLRFSRQAAVSRAMRSLVRGSRTRIERAFDVYVLWLIEDDVDRVVANLDVADQHWDGVSHS